MLHHFEFSKVFSFLPTLHVQFLCFCELNRKVALLWLLMIKKMHVYLQNFKFVLATSLDLLTPAPAAYPQTLLTTAIAVVLVCLKKLLGNGSKIHQAFKWFCLIFSMLTVSYLPPVATRLWIIAGSPFITCV